MGNNLSGEGVGYKDRINCKIKELIYHARLKTVYIEIRQFSSIAMRWCSDDL